MEARPRRRPVNGRARHDLRRAGRAGRQTFRGHLQSRRTERPQADGRSKWAEVGDPRSMEPGADLVLLHPDGSEELLVAVEPQEAIALEDSPNGILAAKRAGLFCVAVPNPLTRQLSLTQADLQIASLAELPLTRLLAAIQQHAG